MSIFKDMINFFKCLSTVDIIFLTSVLILLILIVTLVYFIKINKDTFDEGDFLPPSGEDKKDEISDLILNIEKQDSTSNTEYNDEEGPLLDLESLTKKLEQEKEDRAFCDNYEKVQEEKAIISYDELLEKNKNAGINYEKEELIDDLLVKKVNLNDLINKSNETIKSSNVRVISYSHEEEFLNALRELDRLLN